MSNTNEDDPNCVAHNRVAFLHNGDKTRSPSVESFPNSAKKFKDDLNTSVTVSDGVSVSTDLRLKELEAKLKHAEEEAEELRERCSGLEEKASEAIRQQADVEERILVPIELQVRVIVLQVMQDQWKHMPELEQEVASLIEEVAHLRLNPAAEADDKRGEEIEALKAERDSLLARVTLLEKMGGRPEDLTEEVIILRERITSAQPKFRKLLGMGKTMIKEFHEVFSTLLGYKVDRLKPNLYKLTSVYAQSQNDHLMVKLLPNGEVNLLATEFSDTVGEHIEKYLQEQHSFPMFLSAVNMDLFAQQQKA